MAYKHDDKSSGQLIRSADWNLMGHELERLEVDKVNRAGDTIKGDLKVTGKFTGSEGRFESSLSVAGNVGLGTTPTAERLEVAGNVKITGSRLKNSASYGIIQTDATDWLRINPDSQYPAIALYKPVAIGEGGLSIGEWGQLPKGNLKVTGNVGLGTDPTAERLEVAGNVKITGDIKANGTLFAGGNPVLYENFEIYLRGSAFDSPEGNNTFLKVANYSLDMDNRRGLNVVILSPTGKFKAKTSFDVYANSAFWNNWADWVNSNSVEGDIVAVASFDALQNAPRAGSADMLLRSIGAVEAFSAVKNHARSPYALLFVCGRKAIEISNPYKGPNAHIKTTYYNLLNSLTQGNSYISSSPNRHRMYPDNPVVYQDIFEARDKGVIVKLGNPGYDETTYSTNPWQARRIIRFGLDNEADGNGAQVTIPTGYNTVWVRVLGDRWTVMKAYFLDGDKEDLGLWAGGYRATNCYCPDGSLSDGYYFVDGNQNRTAHQWVPIPVRRSGQLALIAKPNTASHFWVSGIAFSQNPWAHAAQSAVAYHWGLNGGSAVKWNTHVWNDDVLAEITANSKYELKVPVVPSGRDKLLYLVEHNNNWNGTMHNGLSVNGQPIERFLASYDNPFARHWNSKFYERYLAARIPAALIPADAKWLSVRIDMGQQNNSIYFREIGSHDLEIP
jgi:hypothetical protein